jgi:hypothetical protein
MTTCLSRWGASLPGPVCGLDGNRTLEQVRAVTEGAAAAVFGILACSLAGIVYEWKRSGLSFRDWLDSIR